MRKKHLVGIITMLTLYACQGETEKLTHQLNQLQEENIELKRQTETIAQKDSAIAAYAQYMLEIQENLNLINKKENELMLKSRNPEFQRNDETILADLQELGKLLAENEAKTQQMRNQLNQANSQVTGLEEVVLQLTQQVEQRDSEILNLKGELSDLGVAFDELLAAYESNIELLAQQNQLLEEQAGQLTTAHYAIGTTKELQANGVITKEGGFIGIGKTKMLKNDFNEDYFTEVKINETGEIGIGGAKKANILTNHPENSYEWVKENNRITQLTIKDTLDFWSVSKYLVVEIK